MAQVDLTHEGNPVNDSKSTAPRSESFFPLNYIQMDTAQFGQLKPHFAVDVVPKDRRMSLRCDHEVDSYTLKAPLKQNISIKKDYFFVPKEAVLPLQAERIITNPNIGDDVPLLANTVVENFRKRLWQHFKGYVDLVKGSTATTATAGFLNICLRLMLQMRYFYSNGSLLDSLGYSNAGYLVYDKTVDGHQVVLSFDKWFDDLCDILMSHIQQFNVNLLNIEDSSVIPTSPTIVVYCENATRISRTAYQNLTLKSFIEWTDDYPNFNVTGISYVNTSTGSADLQTALVAHFGKLRQTFNSTASGQPFNYERLAAYQLVAAHFYTNDAVDFVYEANLYRQVVQNCVDVLYSRNIISGATDFAWNGLKLDFDSLSGQFMDQVLNVTASTITIAVPQLLVTHVYFSLIFAYRRSLRFVDYFTAAKSRPLAIGDTTVAVDANNHVDVVDVTRSIQWQRFFNSVNRTGRKISEYIKGLFPGNQMAPDYHNPLYLGHTSDVIYASNVENTGDAQMQQSNSVTATLKSNASRYAFEFDCDRYGVVLGIEYFDVQRMYAHASDRQFFHTNRFDMFNPFLQFIGDQKIFREEIDDTDASVNSFGYQLRHMEYKQRINRACGGFVESLPGWAFLADDVLGLPRSMNISPDYIRSSCVELDPFYVSLTGWSYGTYYHFIIKTVNDCKSNRPMVYTPQIL